jgi:CubicO group peptidase (beta-lactamase class C family)
MVSYVINASGRDLRYCAPSRGVLSNAEDLVKFGHAVLHSELLNNETRKTMFNSIPLLDDIPSMAANAWLLMWDKYDNTIYGKSGLVTGGSAGILVYPDLDLIVACTANLNTSANDIPVFGISNPFIAKPESEEEGQE